MAARLNRILAALMFLGLCLLGTGTAYAQQVKDVERLMGRMAKKLSVAPLQGLRDCGVLIENLNEEAIRGGLNERRLQSEVVEKLKSLGIRVADASVSFDPHIYVNVMVTRLPNVGSVYTVSLDFSETAMPTRDKTIVYYGTTWHQMTHGLASRNDLQAKVTRGLAALLDEFRKDYSLANSQ